MPKIGYSRLPTVEEEICLRLREVRRQLRWKQRDFAEELGITRDRLASYEYARAPLRYSLAKRMGEVFDVNQRWLATGKPPKKGYISVSEAIEAALPKGALFSFAYKNLLADWLDEAHKEAAKLQGVEEKDIDPMVLDGFQPLGDPEARLRDACARELDFLCGIRRILPIDLIPLYVDAVREAAWKFLNPHREEIDSYMKGRGDQGEKSRWLVGEFAKRRIQAGSKKKSRNPHKHGTLE